MLSERCHCWTSTETDFTVVPFLSHAFVSFVMFTTGSFYKAVLEKYQSDALLYGLFKRIFVGRKYVLKFCCSEFEF